MWSWDVLAGSHHLAQNAKLHCLRVKKCSNSDGLQPLITAVGSLPVPRSFYKCSLETQAIPETGPFFWIHHDSSRSPNDMGDCSGAPTTVRSAVLSTSCLGRCGGAHRGAAPRFPGNPTVADGARASRLRTPLVIVSLVVFFCGCQP